MVTRTLLNTLYRMIYPFASVMARGLGVSYREITQALTWRSAVGIIGPLLAGMADSRGRRWGMLTGLSLYFGGLAIIVFLPTYPAFVLMLLVTALGKLTFDPSMQAYLGDRIGFKRRGQAIALVEMGWAGAYFFGVPVVGFMISRAGWAAPFPLLLGLSALAILGLGWMLPPDPGHTNSSPTMWRNFGLAFRSRAALAGLWLSFCMSLANEFINISFGGWLESSFNLHVAALGIATSVIGFSELGGEGLVTFFADRIGKERAVGIGLTLNILSSLALPVLGTNLTGALAGLFFYYLTFEFSYVTLISLMTEVLPSARATLMALNIMMASLGRAMGDAAGPILFSGEMRPSLWAAILMNLAGLLSLRWVAVKKGVS